LPLTTQQLWSTEARREGKDASFAPAAPACSTRSPRSPRAQKRAENSQVAGPPVGVIGLIGLIRLQVVSLWCAVLFLFLKWHLQANAQQLIVPSPAE
jgi:hypothetical protein